MHKQVYLTREFALNKSKTKSLWVAYSIIRNEAIPICNIFGDKSEIYLDVDCWHGIRHSKKELFAFMTGKCKDYYRNFENEQYITVAIGKVGASGCPMLYLQQTNKKNGKMDYLYLGFVTVDRLFGLESLINHYLLYLERNQPEVNEFLKEYHQKKLSADVSYLEYLNKQTKFGLDLGMLVQELDTHPLD